MFLKKALAFMLLFAAAVNSFAVTPVASREYKLMLEPSNFNGTNPATAVSAFWNALQQVIASGIGRSTSGTFALDKSRTVRFYDTPGTCLLSNNKLIFRERVESGNREVTLKYRSFDRFVSSYQDMSGIGGDAETKFEEDLGAPYSVKYSHSTTQGISDSKNLNRMDDPIGLYPGLESYNFDDTLPIAVVGGLTVAERVYKGPSVDLGSENGAFSLTLWYAGGDLTAPLVAEISFKYKDAAEDYSENVVTRAQNLFLDMQTMTAWLAADAVSKTAFIYGYDPSFCR